MKPRLFVVLSLAALWLFILFTLLQHAAPGTSSAAPGTVVLPGDVVINEVAWGGTAASSSDEWIELKNNIAFPISLTGWTLTNTGSISVVLVGVIPAHGYFLLERGDNNTISDIPADQIYSNALLNPPTSDHLVLRDNTGGVIDTANGDGGTWPAGSAGLSFYSMERVDPLAPDTDGNWASNDGIIRNGHDANGNPINGTPKARNSVTPVPSADLSIAKFGPAGAQPGQIITYTIHFSNTGALPAVNVQLTDTLPPSVSFMAATNLPAQPITGTLVWTIDSVPTGGQIISLTVVGLVASDASGWLTNRVTITTVTTETIAANNSASFSTGISITPPSPAQVLISAVHYYGYDSTNDEAIQLTNAGAISASLLNWRLTEGGSTSGATLPAFDLEPGQRAWVANRADSFYAMFGEWPDFAKTPTASALSLAGTWPGLANDSGGDVRLYDAVGALQDRLLYGPVTLTPIGGWASPAVIPYTPTNAFARSGQILYRKLDEATGLPHDTDTSADWAQDRADPIAGRRVRYPGWDLETFYRTVQVTQTAWLTIGVAPDNAFQVISQVLASAQHTLTIEVYNFENAALAELLAARAREGVVVTLLLEGSPAGGLTDQEKWACQQLEPVGACWFMRSDAGSKVHARYSNQHAKVIVADDRLVAIGSENLSPRSLPDDDKSDGTAGQRGAVLVTDAPGVVEQVRRIWSADFEPDHHRDLTRWSSSSITYGLPSIGFVPITVTGGTTYTVRFSQPLVLSGTFPFEVIQSPENSLRQSDGLLGLISRAGAGDEIAVEQLQEPPNWGPSSSAPQSDPNVVLEALIAAASRGARVRLLLDAYFDYGDNAATVAYVESLRAVSDTLRANLQARTGNPTALGIHNKMFLASIGGLGYIHVGSLNHGELALKGNREVALQVQSDAAYAYLRRVFDWDWYRIYLPVVTQNYSSPPPPADYVLISEVYYSATVTKQWVEIYNPTLQAIDLSNYKIGDAESPDKYEGTYRFPAGTVIGPHGVFVIAFDATQVPQANFQMCSTCPSSVPVLQKHPAWGAGDWWLAGHGDQVVLLGPNDLPVDVVVYGDATYPGVVAHPGVSLYTHSLERYPADLDTNNCAVDFRDRYPPTPGKVP